MRLDELLDAFENATVLAAHQDDAAAILALCDGTLTREQIVARVLPRSKEDSFAVDVREFLNAARRRGWIVED